MLVRIGSNAVAAIILATFLFATPLAAQTVTPANWSLKPYMTGLSSPTGFKFVNNNELFVIEKDTGLVKHVQGSTTTTSLNLGVAQDNLERGLLGIEVDPQFPTNPYVYVYYSHNNQAAGVDGGSWTDNRVSRFTWNGSVLVPSSELTLMQFGSSSDGQATGGNHNGGPIRFGPDGKLYGVTGDLNRSRAEQNTTGQAANSATTGGVYRINPDGTIPSDNPFTGVFSRWYAYGVRNSFGLNFDPVNGNLWDTENGPSSFDEVNLVAKGFNSGWTKIMGPDVWSGDAVVDAGSLIALPPAAGFPGAAYSDPEFSWQTPIAVTSIEFLSGSLVGPSNGVLIGDNNNSNLYLFNLNANRDAFTLSGSIADKIANSSTERDATKVGGGFNVITDIQVGPDGAVYIASLGNGTIYRLIPEPSALWMAGVAAASGLVAVGARRRGRN